MMNHKMDPSNAEQLTNSFYDPRVERDDYGAGFVCRLNNTPSHDIVEKGLQILLKLAHRCAYACDADTGDGAGIIPQMPDRFLRTACKAAWEKQMGGCGSGHPAVTPDMPGFNLSAKPAELNQCHIKTLVEDIRALSDLFTN